MADIFSSTNNCTVLDWIHNCILVIDCTVKVIAWLTKYKITYVASCRVFAVYTSEVEQVKFKFLFIISRLPVIYRVNDDTGVLVVKLGLLNTIRHNYALVIDDCDLAVNQTCFGVVIIKIILQGLVAKNVDGSNVSGKFTFIRICFITPVLVVSGVEPNTYNCFVFHLTLKANDTLCLSCINCDNRTCLVRLINPDKCVIISNV